MSVDGTVIENLGIGIEEFRTDEGKLGYQIKSFQTLECQTVTERTLQLQGRHH